MSLSCLFKVKVGESDGAASPGAPVGLAAGHINGSAGAAARRFPLVSSDGEAVQQLWPGVGNRDASLSFSEHGSGAGARHGRGGHADLLDSACRPRAGNRRGPPGHIRRSSSDGRGHNGCRGVPLRRSGHSGNFVPEAPPARRGRWMLDRIGH